MMIVGGADALQQFGDLRCSFISDFVQAINLNLKDCKRLIPVQEHDHWRMD